MEQSAYVDGKLPSGWNDEDLDHFVLNGMYTMLNRASSVNVDGDDEDDNGDVDETVERPDGWIFPGWFAYRLLGSHAHNDFRSPLFEVGDWDRNKRNGSKDSTGGRSDHQKALA